MKFHIYGIALVVLLVLGCIGSQVETCNDSQCVINHVNKKQCAPLLYNYEGKTFEIQSEVRDSTGYLQACKVHLKWNDGTDMTCYPKYGIDIERIINGTPSVNANCSGSYLEVHGNVMNKTT